MKLFLKKILLIVAGLLAALLVLELLLTCSSMFFKIKNDYNSAKENKSDTDIKILCLGESTTGPGLRFNWPEQLDTILNSETIEKKYSIINKGVGGTNTSIILSELQGYINEYEPDIVISMIGINDNESEYCYADDARESLHYVRKKNQARTIYLLKLIKKHLLVRCRSSLAKLGKQHQGISERTGAGRYVDHAKYYISQGNVDRAYENLDKAIEIDAKFWEAYYIRAKLIRTIDMDSQQEIVISNYIKAIEAAPERKESYLLLIVVYLGENQPDKALLLCYNAIKRTVFTNDDFSGLIETFLEKEEYEKSKVILDLAMKDYPEDWHINLLRGIISFFLYDNEQAAKYIRIGFESAESVESFYSSIQKYIVSSPDGGLKKMVNVILKEYGYEYNMLYKLNVLNESDLREITKQNYIKIKSQLDENKIPLIIMQYPRRSLKPLKELFAGHDNIVFVDNEKCFKDAVKASGYDAYFTDMFGGDFGHASQKGNRIIAENVAAKIFEIYKQK